MNTPQHEKILLSLMKKVMPLIQDPGRTLYNCAYREHSLVGSHSLKRDKPDSEEETVSRQIKSLSKVKNECF